VLGKLEKKWRRMTAVPEGMSKKFNKTPKSQEN